MNKEKSKKILIITYEMIPFADSWGACQRMYYLAEALASENYKVWVASSKLSFKPNAYQQPINFNQVIIDHPMKSIQSRIDYDKSPTPKSLLKYFKMILKEAIKIIDKIIFNEPNVGSGIYSYFWVRKLSRKLKSIITENEITLIIISGPPFTLFRLVQGSVEPLE
jgi:hypothetical protein